MSHSIKSDVDGYFKFVIIVDCVLKYKCNTQKNDKNILVINSIFSDMLKKKHNKIA